MTVPELMRSATLQTLRAARERVAQGWVQDVPAVNDKGKHIMPTWSSDACAWCSTGAIEASARSWYVEDYRYAVAVLHEAIFDGDLSYNNMRRLEVWNDDKDRTQGEVLAAFDKAISRMEENR